MVEKLEEFPGWPIYKIKLGTPNDLEIVKDAPRTYRRRLSGSTPIARGRRRRRFATRRPWPSWGSNSSNSLFQPKRSTRCPAFMPNRPSPLIADESCRVPADVARCEGRFHGINIKLCKCGGLTAARGMIDDAHARGMKVMVGCMTESTVGISAIGQVLPLLDYVDMDGSVLLAEDVADGVQVRKGTAVYPEENGSGIRFWGESRTSGATA